MSQNDLVAQFVAISGKNESVGKNFLQTAGWNLELALSNYFGSGDYAPPDDHAVDNPPPPSSQQPQSQPQATVIVPPVPVADDDSTIGLFVKGDRAPVPLAGLSIKAEVVDLAAEVEVGQRFVNNTDNPLEAVFVFQQEDCSIFDMVVEVDGKVIKGICKEKEEAFAQYDDSISSGHGAFLLESSDSKKDEFKLNVGNLAPGQQATVVVKYITELQSEGEAIKFALPITRVPIVRSTKASTTTTTTTKSGEGDVPTINEGLNVTINIKSASPILGIEAASSHAIDAKVDGNSAVVTYSSIGDQQASFETLRLVVGFTEANKPKLLLETEEGEESALMVSFYPKIKEAIKAASPLDFDEDTYHPFSEMIFLVDRSGSMAGSRMNQAKNALHLFLRSLPEGTQFNIYGFGSSFVKLFPSSVEYNDRTFAAATQHVNEMNASLAGTDILPPLRDIFQQGPNPDYPRQVFCLTDGEVTNTDEVLEYIRKSGQGTRIFTFGIGADASPELVRGMAKAGRGEAELVASGTRLESKVLRQLQRALQPTLKNVRVEWGEKLQAKAKQSPPVLPPIFEGERVLFYALLDKDVQLDDLKFAELVLKAQTADADPKEIVFPLKFDEGELVLEKEKKLAHRLAASALIRHLSSDKDLSKQNKDEITRLGVRYSLASEFTSFVAVNERTEAVEGSMAQVKVNEAVLDNITAPSLLPTGDSRYHSVGGLQSHSQSFDVDSRSTAESFFARSQQRSENLDDLVSLSADLSEQSKQFLKSAKPLSSSSSLLGGFMDMVSKPFAAMYSAAPTTTSTRSARASYAESNSPAPTASAPRPHSSWDDSEDEDEAEAPKAKQALASYEEKRALQKEVEGSDFENAKDIFGEGVADPSSPRDSAKKAEGGERKGKKGHKEKKHMSKRKRAASPSGGAAKMDLIDECMSAEVDEKESVNEGIDVSLYSRQLYVLGQHQQQQQQQQQPKPIVNPHMRPLDRLVQLQQFNGSWVVSKDIAELLKATSEESLKASLPEALKAVTGGETFWVTALALALLELSFADSKEEWQLLAAKGTQWLKIQTKKVAVDYADLVKQANSAVQNWLNA